MTNKESVRDLPQRNPENIARELEFIAAVKQGLIELDNGDSVPLEDVERELPSWLSSSLTSRAV
jgi:hypothetical protein